MPWRALVRGPVCVGVWVWVCDRVALSLKQVDGPDKVLDPTIGGRHQRSNVRTEKTEAPMEERAALARASLPGSLRGSQQHHHRLLLLLLLPPVLGLMTPGAVGVGVGVARKLVATWMTNSTASPTAMTRFTTETALIRTP